jgi:hypothetical protein
MGPLLEQLEALRGYEIDSKHHISSVAFANDPILLANDQQKAQELLHRTELYLKKLGMSIAAD